MRYVNTSLREGESIRGAFRQTRLEYLDPLPLYVVAGFFGVEIFTAALVFVCFVIWLRRWTTEYAVTNKRVITKKGLIARHTDEINTEAVESVWMKQGIVARVFRFGDLFIEGRGNNVIVMKRVAGVLDAKRIIDAAVAGEAVSAEETAAPKYAAVQKQKLGISEFKTFIFAFAALASAFMLIGIFGDGNFAETLNESSAAHEPETKKSADKEKEPLKKPKGAASAPELTSVLKDLLADMKQPAPQGSKKKEEEKQGEWEQVRADFERLVSKSDDFTAHRNIFARAAFELVKQGVCTKTEIADNGGFVRKSSTSEYKHLPVYFVTCGNYKTGYRKRYLNIQTGQIHQ